MTGFWYEQLQTIIFGTFNKMGSYVDTSKGQTITQNAILLSHIDIQT